MQNDCTGYERGLEVSLRVNGTLGEVVGLLLLGVLQIEFTVSLNCALGVGLEAQNQN